LPGGQLAAGLFLVLSVAGVPDVRPGRKMRPWAACRGFGSARQDDDFTTPIVSGVAMSYTNATEHHMTLLNKVFTTRTLIQIIFVLIAVVVMKAISTHYDFSWATAFAAG
jgi:hypothetical protein